MKAHNTKFMKYNRSNSYREIYRCKALHLEKKKKFKSVT